MLKKLGMLLTIPLAVSLMSCAKSTTETVRTVSDYCLISKGISFSQKKDTQVEDASNKYDTEETIKQVRDHDLTYERLCPSSP